MIATEHKATEEAIAASGVPAVIVRNNWYTENYAADVARAAETGVIASSAGDGRVASASRVDYAEGAAVVLLEEGHLGKVLRVLGGCRVELRRTRCGGIRGARSRGDLRAAHH